MVVRCFIVMVPLSVFPRPLPLIKRSHTASQLQWAIPHYITTYAASTLHLSLHIFIYWRARICLKEAGRHCLHIGWSLIIVFHVARCLLLHDLLFQCCISSSCREIQILLLIRQISMILIAVELRLAVILLSIMLGT